nr:transcriptional regulator XRE family [uncultured bacterium]
MGKTNLQQKFGKLVRRWREGASLTQEKLADEAGIHRTYISLLECGQCAPTIEVVRRLAKAFKTTMTAIVAELEGVDVIFPSASGRRREKS